MRKEIQIHRIATSDRESTSIFINPNENNYLYQYTRGQGNFYLEHDTGIPQHLYATVSQEVEPIKEGDWCIITNQAGTEFICQFRGDKYYFYNPSKSSNQGYIEHITGCGRKIIATTDKKLTLFNNIDDRTIYLNGIQQSFIKEYCNKGGIDKALVEYISIPDGPEDPYSGFDKWKEVLKLNPDNTITIHPLEEQIILPIHIHEGIYNTHVDIIDGEIHVKPNHPVPNMYTEEQVIDLLFRTESTPLHEREFMPEWIKDNL